MANSTSPINSPIKGRSIECTIHMLDDSKEIFIISAKSDGRVLLTEIINKLQLIEFDYFDLQYTDSEGVQCWLDKDKLITKQVSSNGFIFKFLVKFYTPDPGLLEEEYTRYLFALQIKRDLREGHLTCQEHTSILMASYILQAELGDYRDELARQNYIAGIKLLPVHSLDIDYKICQQHQLHIGQSQLEADFNFLDTARKVELYGIRMNQAKDNDGIVLNLAVTHAGIMVFQNTTKINFFSWAKIRKLCFKRKKFIVKLHPDGNTYNKDSVEFYFPTRNWSKNFWKQCIEHHAFFRCHTVRTLHKNKSKVVSRGSSFRYTGRTQKELMEYVREHPASNSSFERSTSMRTVSMTTSRAGTPKGSNFQTLDYGSQTLDRPYGSYQNQLAYPVSERQMALSPNSDGSNQLSYYSRTLPNFPQKKFGASNQSSFASHESTEAVIDPNQFMLPTLNGQHHRHQHFNNKKPIPQPQSFSNTYHPSSNYSSNFQPPYNSAPYTENSLGSSIPYMDERGVLSGVYRDTERATSSSISSPEYSDQEIKKKLFMNFDYAMLKEIIMTERTFRRDLEIICVHLKDHVNDIVEVAIFFREFLLNLFEPLYECHCHLLNDFEQLLTTWDMNYSLIQREHETEKTLLLHLKHCLPFYHQYLSQLYNLMAQYHSSIKNQPQFEEMVSSFEAKKKKVPTATLR